MYFMVFICSLLCSSVSADTGDKPFTENKENQSIKRSKKKKKTTPLVMRFPFTVDEEIVGEIIGEKSRSADQEDKIQAEGLKNALEPFLPKDKISELIAAQNNNGFIPFSSLIKMGFPIDFDLSAMQINLKIPAQFKKDRKKKINKSGNQALKEDVESASVSSALNVRLSRSESSGNGTNTAIISPNINLLGLNVESRISGDQNKGQKMSWYRDYFSTIYDFRESGNRLTFFDVSSDTINYQSVPKLFGVGFNHYASKKERSLSTDVSVEIFRPSTAKIYVNDILVQTEKLFPGTYTYDDISFKYGSNDVRMEIEDDTGKITNLNKSYFRDGGILDFGEYEYGVSFGKPEVKTDEGRYSKTPMMASFLKAGLGDCFEGDIGWHKNTVGQLQSYGLSFGSFVGTSFFSCARSIQDTELYGKTRGYAKKIQFSATPIQLFDVNIPFSISAEKRNKTFMPYEQDISGVLKKIERENTLLGSTTINGAFGISTSSIGSIKFSGSKRIYTDKTNEISRTVTFTKNFRMNNNIFSDASIAFDFSREKSRLGKKSKMISASGVLNFKNNVSITGYRKNNLIKGTNEYYCGITVPYPKIESIPMRGSITKSNSSKSQIYSTTMHYESENLRGDMNYFHQKSDRKIQTTKNAALETTWYFADGNSALSSKSLGNSGFVMVVPAKELEKYPISLRNDDQADTGGIVDTVPYDEVRAFKVKTPNMPLGIKIDNPTFNVMGEYKRGSIVHLSSSGGSCAIKGVLKYQNGQPVTNTLGYVTLLSEKRPKTSFFTNKKGKFSIIGLKAGKYELTITGETLISPAKFTVKQIDKFEYQKIGTKLVKNPPDEE